MLVEIVLRAGFKSVHAVSQEDLIGVQGEDLLLGEVPLDLHGQHGLLHFAVEIALR